ncbi:c-type cytochrome [Pseudoduganella sp. LjRoot289]|uniref:c-type cytochrome n=1 Tax=Pseudoduganella sp. LjRoot289 TaxID=3342314 RepID=UPI003ECD6190
MAACAALAATAALPAIAVPSAHAAEAIPSGARLAATCTGCHGTNGATTGNALPSLAGQPKDVLLASLQAFKVGTRPVTIMTQIAKGYSDEQLAQLASFFAAQAAKPAEGARP